MSNTIKVVPEYFRGYANMPRFSFEFEELFPVHSYTEGVYKHMTADSLLVITELPGDVRTRYQTVCQEWRDGNTNYAYGPYPAGWSSRVSVVNKVFDKCLVEAGHGYGIHVSLAISLIAENYDGTVLMWFEDHDIEREFNIIPWDYIRASSSYVPEGIDKLFLAADSSMFVESADAFFSKYHKSL